MEIRIGLGMGLGEPWGSGEVRGGRLGTAGGGRFNILGWFPH